MDKWNGSAKSWDFDLVIPNLFCSGKLCINVCMCQSSKKTFRFWMTFYRIFCETEELCMQENSYFFPFSSRQYNFTVGSMKKHVLEGKKDSRSYAKPKYPLPRPFASYLHKFQCHNSWEYPLKSHWFENEKCAPSFMFNQNMHIFQLLSSIRKKSMICQPLKIG